MEKNEDIKEAKEELNQLSKDETLRRIALKEELLRMDINQAKADAEEYGREEGREEGRKEGRKEGREEGIAEGERKNKIKVVRKLHKLNMPIEEIAEVVELDMAEVKQILGIQD